MLKLKIGELYIMQDLFAALPDEIFPLIVAGSNEIATTLRVSRRYAALCVVPELVSPAGWLTRLRRGKFSITTDECYDKKTKLYILEDNAVRHLWEIVGVRMHGYGFYKVISRCCAGKPPGIAFAYNYKEMGSFMVGTAKIVHHADGLQVRSRVQSVKESIEMLRPYDSKSLPDPKYIVVVHTIHGRFPWVGKKNIVKWAAANFTSTLLERI